MRILISTKQPLRKWGLMDFEKQRHFAKLHAIRKGFDRDAEDFAQEVCLAYVRGRKATISQLFTDYLRQWYGDTRTLGGRIRSRATLFYENEPERCSDGMLGPDGDNWQCVVGFLKGSDKCIITLKYKWGLSEAEIGNCFGVTESRICQRIKGIQGRIRKRIEAQESRIQEETKTVQQGIRQEKREEMAIGTDQEMARRESRGLEGAYETGFREWLT